jgi:hypothetical protein
MTFEINVDHVLMLVQKFREARGASSGLPTSPHAARQS